MAHLVPDQSSLLTRSGRMQECFPAALPQTPIEATLPRSSHAWRSGASGRNKIRRSRLAAAGWELLAMEWLSSPYSSPGFAGWRGSIAALLQKDEVNYVGQVKSPACRIIAAIFQRPSGSADCGVALSASSATIAAWGVRISRGRAKGRGVAEVRPLPAAINAKRSAAAPMR